MNWALINFTILVGVLVALSILIYRLYCLSNEIWGVLEIVKAWAESARTHHKDAETITSDIKREVPPKTAELVADRIMEAGLGGGSGIVPAYKPPLR